MRSLRFLIEPEWDKSPVGTYLIKAKKLSRRLLIQLKRTENGILLNEKHIRTVDTVRTGDTLAILLEDSKTLDANPTLHVPIVYEDEDVIVFDKPVGMPVHPSHRHQGDTLGNAFAAHCPGISFRPINRLDRDTSGLCAVAKNAHAAARLQKSLNKTYFAVACGEMSGSGTICAPIARAGDSIILRKVSPEGQDAVTDYTVLAVKNGYTLLRIQLHTGRTHQIRVHFSHIGFPLAGDELYGGSRRNIDAQALYCGELSFLHPVSGERLEFASPIRADMKRLIR